MLIRIFFYLLGYSMAVSGGISSIAYLNLLSMGNSFYDYINFIIQRPEFYLLPLGIGIFTVSIFYPKANGNP